MIGSQIRHSHEDCDRVQDPYSIRCQPQVMGACLEALRHAASILEIEANAVSDNPLVFAKEGEILSGGNFHAEPVALVADMMALVICEIGSLAERRIAMLVDPALSRLPAFLTEPGDPAPGHAAPEDATPADRRDGLRLTGHFLARDAFGHRHRPLPQARRMLYDRVAVLAEESENHHAG